MIAIAGAGVLLLPEISAVSGPELTATAIGCAAALASGLVALRIFIWFLREQRFHLFAWYAWALGAATLIGVAVVSG
jgi:undecaprenyl-diphosphatase